MWIKSYSSARLLYMLHCAAATLWMHIESTTQEDDLPNNQVGPHCHVKKCISWVYVVLIHPIKRWAKRSFGIRTREKDQRRMKGEWKKWSGISIMSVSREDQKKTEEIEDVERKRKGRRQKAFETKISYKR